MSRKKNARSERTGQVQLCGEEAAFTFLRKSHGRAFESALKMPPPQKDQSERIGLFVASLQYTYSLFTITYYFPKIAGWI